MIIYQAQPNKVFPPLAFALAQKIQGLSHEVGIQLESLDGQFCYPFHGKNKQGEFVWYRYHEMLQNKSPNNQKLSRTFYDKPITFLAGVFDEFRIDKQPGDFVFTIISHPVNRVYDLYYFMKLAFEKKAVPRNHILHILKSANPAFIPPTTLESFIDIFLEQKGQIRIGDYFFCNNVFHQQKNFEIFDFVGICENMGSTLGQLSHLLGIDIPPHWDLYESRHISNRTYRRTEIEKLMPEAINQYKKLASRL